MSKNSNTRFSKDITLYWLLMIMHRNNLVRSKDIRKYLRENYDIEMNTSTFTRDYLRPLRERGYIDEHNLVTTKGERIYRKYMGRKPRINDRDKMTLSAYKAATELGRLLNEQF